MWTLFMLLFLFGTASMACQPGYIDLTPQFSKFFDETSGMEQATRVARFHELMGSLLPGFYAPRFGLTSAEYDARIARALEKFPEIRTQYLQRDFPAACTAGVIAQIHDAGRAAISYANKSVPILLKVDRPRTP